MIVALISIIFDLMKVFDLENFISKLKLDFLEFENIGELALVQRFFEKLTE